MGHYDAWCDHCGVEIGWSGLAGRCCQKAKQISAERQLQNEIKEREHQQKVLDAQRILKAYNVPFKKESVSIFDVVTLIKTLAG